MIIASLLFPSLPVTSKMVLFGLLSTCVSATASAALLPFTVRYSTDCKTLFKIDVVESGLTCSATTCVNGIGTVCYSDLNAAAVKEFNSVRYVILDRYNSTDVSCTTIVMSQAFIADGKCHSLDGIGYTINGTSFKVYDSNDCSSVTEVPTYGAVLSGLDNCNPGTGYFASSNIKSSYVTPAPPSKRYYIF